MPLLRPNTCFSIVTPDPGSGPLLAHTATCIQRRAQATKAYKGTQMDAQVQTKIHTHVHTHTHPTLYSIPRT